MSGRIYKVGLFTWMTFFAGVTYAQEAGMNLTLEQSSE